MHATVSCVVILSFVTLVLSNCGTIEENTNYKGNDLRKLKIGNSADPVEDCCTFCLSVAGCKAWSLVGDECFAKSSGNNKEDANGVMSGTSAHYQGGPRLLPPGAGEPVNPPPDPTPVNPPVVADITPPPEAPTDQTPDQPPADQPVDQPPADQPVDAVPVDVPAPPVNIPAVPVPRPNPYRPGQGTPRPVYRIPTVRPVYQPGRPVRYGGYRPARPAYQGGRPAYQGGARPARPTYHAARPAYQGGARPARPIARPVGRYRAEGDTSSTFSGAGSVPAWGIALIVLGVLVFIALVVVQVQLVVLVRRRDSQRI